MTEIPSLKDAQKLVDYLLSIEAPDEHIKTAQQFRWVAMDNATRAERADWAGIARAALRDDADTPRGA